jgi:hypothetical protein
VADSFVAWSQIDVDVETLDRSEQLKFERLQ